MEQQASSNDIATTSINFAELCFSLRKKKGLTQIQMAHYYSVSPRTYKYWESGQSKPQADKIAIILQLRDEIEAVERKIEKQNTIDSQPNVDRHLAELIHDNSGKHIMIYGDFAQLIYDEILLPDTTPAIGTDCIVFMWVMPSQVPKALKGIEGLGLRYWDMITRRLRPKEWSAEYTKDYIEHLIISIKGVLLIPYLDQSLLIAEQEVARYFEAPEIHIELKKQHLFFSLAKILFPEFIQLQAISNSPNGKYYVVMAAWDRSQLGRKETKEMTSNTITKKITPPKGHAEDAITLVFENKGYWVEHQVHLVESLYGTKMPVDLIIRGLLEFPEGLIIESKSQDQPGTVDEKLPYLVLNIKEKYPLPTIIVLDGGGYRSGAIDWVKSQIDNKLIAVYENLGDFFSWARNLPDAPNKK